MRHYIIILSVLFALLFSINSSAQNKKDKIIKSAEKHAIPLDFYDYPILIEERDSGLRYFMIHDRLFSSNIFNSLSQEDLEYEKDSLEFYSNGEARLLFTITQELTYVKEYAIWKAFNDDIGSGLREGRKELNKKKKYYKSLGGGTDPNPYDSLKPLKLDHINLILNSSYINDNERQLYADSLRILIKEYDQNLIYSIDALNRECNKFFQEYDSLTTYETVKYYKNTVTYVIKHTKYLIGENWYINLNKCISNSEMKDQLFITYTFYMNKRFKFYNPNLEELVEGKNAFMVSSFNELSKKYPIGEYRYIIRYTIKDYIQPEHNSGPIYIAYIYDRLTKTGYPAIMSQYYPEAIKNLIKKAQQYKSK